jgi:hypothetical protein
MRPLMEFALCCLLAPGLFAGHDGSAAVSGGAMTGGHAGSVTAGHHAGHAHASMRTFGYGRYGGYGYGGFYEPLYDYGYSPAAEPGGSNVTVVYPPSAPPVTITETAHPVIHEYTQREDYGAPPERENHPILYLIAFRDSTIRAAMTYWVEDGTLHYLDTGHQPKQAPLSSVDRDLSAQLNRERHIPFNIP